MNDFIASAQLRYVKMTARKLRISVNLVRNRSVDEALSLLTVDKKKAAFYVKQLLKSAVANFHDSRGSDAVDSEDLFVKEIMVNEGPTLKRWTPRAMGKASPILKRSSHIVLKLGLRERKV